VARVEFVGRRQHRERLESAFASAGAGNGVALAVRGPAGAGKTALLDEVLRSSPCAVVRVDMREARAEAPGAALLQALELPPPVEGRHAVPVVGRVERSASVMMVVESVIAEIERRAASAPLAFVVDDGQWADPATRVILDQLAERAPAMSLVVIEATRATTSGRFVEIELEPMPIPEIEALVRSVRGPLAGDEIERLAIARGNPFFALLLATGNPAGPIPGDLTSAIRARIAVLDDTAVDVLQLLAVLGPDGTMPEIASLYGRATPEVLMAVERLRAAGLVAATGDHVYFVHDLVREAVESEMPASVVRALHAQAARMLDGISLHRAARHLEGGARAGDLECANALRDVAVLLRDRDPERAVQLLDRAAEISGAAATRLRIDVEQVIATANASQVDRALELGITVMERLSPGEDFARVAAVLGQALVMRGGSVADALRYLRAAIETATGSPRAKALLLGDVSVAQLLAGDFAAAQMSADDALALARVLDQPAPLCDAYCVLAFLASFRFDLADALRWARLAVDVVGDDLEVRRRSAPEYFLALVVLGSADLDEGAAVCAAGRASLEAAGALWAVPLLHFAAGATAYHQGHWDRALAEIESGHALAGEVGSMLGVSFGHAIATLIFEARDELTRARAALAAAESAAAAEAATGGDTLLLARARMADADGDPTAGLRIVKEAWEFDRAMGMLDDLPDLAVEIAHAALSLRDRATLEWIVTDFEAALGGHPRAAGHVAWCRALLERSLGPLADAIAMFDDPRPQRRGAVRADEAMLAAAAGDHDRAATALDQALDCFDQLGATRWTTRALAAARSAGVVTRRRAPSAAESRVGWEGLSRTELDVVRLVAEGLTNRGIGERLFISHRTVETHVKHVFERIGVRSRVELAARWQDRG
jgi:DNA-binding CsgD family transcriptional regulator